MRAKMMIASLSVGLLAACAVEGSETESPVEKETSSSITTSSGTWYLTEQGSDCYDTFGTACSGEFLERCYPSPPTHGAPCDHPVRSCYYWPGPWTSFKYDYYRCL